MLLRSFQDYLPTHWFAKKISSPRRLMMFRKCTQWGRRFMMSIMAAPVTRESLAAYYASMPDNQLKALDQGSLTSDARELLRAELARRQCEHARRGGKSA